MEWFDTWGLPLIVFLPLVGALVLGLIPKEKEDAVKATALLFSLVTFGLSLVAIGLFDFDLDTTTPTSSR